jgi:hypothetical protein
MMGKVDRIKRLTAMAIVLLGAAAAADAPATPPAEGANPVDQLAVGRWLEVPDSKLASVAFQWPAGVTFTRNGVGVKGVISCWSGGAYDSKRDRLIVWGGGHSAYAGNEIYAFDVGRLKWVRVNDPTLDTDPEGNLEATGLYADGNPRSNHTYNYVQYVPAIDRFCSFGMAGTFPSGQKGTNKNFAFDFEKARWEIKSVTPAHGIGACSAVDPVTGRAWVRGNGRGAVLAEWDPAGDVWTDRSGGLTNKTNYAKTAAIDPLRRRMYAVGGKQVYRYEIGKAGRIAQDTVTTTGPQDVVEAACPGLEYDPVLDKLVGWAGGPDVFTLDLDTLQWAKVSTSKDNRATPTPPCGTGTYGRFRYMPSRNAYIVVNDVSQNVFVCRLTDLAGQDVPAGLAEATARTDVAVATYAIGQIQRFAPAKAGPVLKAALDQHRQAFAQDKDAARQAIGRAIVPVLRELKSEPDKQELVWLQQPETP